jgi:hypothetical protein
MQALFTQRTLWILILFMILFLVAGTLSAPQLINWYASPFLPQGASGISCAPSIDWAMKKLVFFQLISLLMGLVSGVLVAIYFRSRKSGIQTP